MSFDTPSFFKNSPGIQLQISLPPEVRGPDRLPTVAAGQQFASCAPKGQESGTPAPDPIANNKPEPKRTQWELSVATNRGGITFGPHNFLLFEPDPRRSSGWLAPGESKRIKMIYTVPKGALPVRLFHGKLTLHRFQELRRGLR